MKLSVLLNDTGIMISPSLGQIKIKGLAYNSQDVNKDFLFVAIRGFSTDGHKYIAAAIDNGAEVIAIEKLSLLKKYDLSYKGAFILYNNKKVPFVYYKDNRILLSRASANFYDHPSKKVKLIGITGTNGKTTTSYLIEKILKSNGYKVGVIGTINYRMGKKRIKARTTTPESLDLHSLLDDMRKRKVDYVIMEVSSHSLALHRVDDCHFDHVIFTNLTEDHFDFHGDFASYFKAKRILFEQLVKSEKKIKSGFVNINDKYGLKLFHQYKNARNIALFTCGIKKRADFQAENIKMDLDKLEFNFKYKNKDYQVETRLIGRFNVHNILAAFGIGVIERVPVNNIIKSIASFHSVPGRLEIIRSNDYYIGIDYAHTEDALKNVLETVKDLNPSRIISIFGCGGDRDRAKRPLMGKVATEYSDFIIVTSDNPRSEDPVSIIKDIEKGIKKKSLLSTVKLLIGRKLLRKDYPWPGKEILYLSQEKAMRIIRL